MKVKSMKKALSLLCAGAMIATSFAVVNFDTVKASEAWNTSTATGTDKYFKVPLKDLTCTADTEEVNDEDSGRQGRDEFLIDGNPNTYYHSKYHGGNQVNFGNNTNNKISLTFASRKVAGITYLVRQNSSRPNGTIDRLEVEVKTDTTDWTKVNVKPANGGAATGEYTIQYSSNWAQENTKEHVILFDTPQANVTGVRLVVKAAQGNVISGSELSVLTPAVYNAEGVYNVDDFVVGGERVQVPTVNGKVFGGWYKESTYTTPLEKETKTGQAHAKLVDANVLQAKAQTIATTGLNTPTTTLRFVSTVDSLEYDTVGFDVTANGITKSLSASNVYSQLLSVDGNGGVSLDKPTGFSSESKYFFALNINGIKTANFDSNWTAVPFWITKDGTKVCGKAVNASVYSELRDFYLSTIKYTTNGANKTGIAKADNWTRFDQINRNNGGFEHNLVSSIPQLNKFKLSGNKNWVIWNENYNTVLFSKKLETQNDAREADNYALEYTFNGTGIVVFCSGLAESRTFDVQVDTGEVKTVQLAQLRDKHGNFGIMAYYVTGLNPGEHTLKVSKVTGKVTFEGFYTIPAANK